VHTTYLLSVDDLLVLTPDTLSSELLNTLLSVYLQGQQRPDALFTESVLDYVKQACTLKNSSKAQKPALQVAQEKLVLSLDLPYEQELQRLYGAVTDLDALLGDEFVVFCENTVLPVWEATHRE
jgi:exonuclease V gamma subunit